MQALAEHLGRAGVDAQVSQGSLPATYRVQYLHVSQPVVSIVVTTRDQQAELQQCLETLLQNTDYPNYEILIVDNGSSGQAAVQYLDGLRALEAETQGRIRVLSRPGPLCLAALRNFAGQSARGDYLLFLNSAVSALHPEWLDNMMAHAQRPEVGVVGAKLLTPNGKIHHAGVVLGLNGMVDRPFAGREVTDYGYYARLMVDQNYSAVSGDCMLVRRTLFDKLMGFNENGVVEFYSDIDFCLKVGEADNLIVWTPYALMRHEGASKEVALPDATGGDAEESRRREQADLYARWLPLLANDPAYNRYFSLRSTEFEFEPDNALLWDPEWRPAPRIIAQPADRMGCGEYRIIAPTRALINAGRIQGKETDTIYSPPELARIQPDALVLQRQVEPHQIEAIERHKRFNDVFCVFEIDDLLTNVPVKNAHKKHLPKDLYKRLRRAAGICDRLVVATDVLAEAYSGLSR